MDIDSKLEDLKTLGVSDNLISELRGRAENLPPIGELATGGSRKPIRSFFEVIAVLNQVFARMKRRFRLSGDGGGIVELGDRIAARGEWSFDPDGIVPEAQTEASEDEAPAAPEPAVPVETDEPPQMAGGVEDDESEDWQKNLWEGREWK